MIKVRVDGIPAKAEVIHYYEGSAGRCLSGPVPSYSAIMAPEPEEVEFELYDRKGYPAEWLERKLANQRVYEDVESQVLAGIHAEIEDSKMRAKANRLGVDI